MILRGFGGWPLAGARSRAETKSKIFIDRKRLWTNGLRDFKYDRAGGIAQQRPLSIDAVIRPRSCRASGGLSGSRKILNGE